MTGPDGADTVPGTQRPLRGPHRGTWYDLYAMLTSSAATCSPTSKTSPTPARSARSSSTYYNHQHYIPGSAYRDTRPFSGSVHESGIVTSATDFLAIHVRNATLPSQRGIEFTHPLSRPGDDWYFMHNGYLPAAYRRLGLPRSEFDTLEYFDCLLPRGTKKLAQAEVLEVLRSIDAEAASGNAIAVRPDRAYLVHWSPPHTPTPRFFTMYELVEPGMRIVSSEMIPELAPKGNWRALAPDCLVEILFDDLGA